VIITHNAITYIYTPTVYSNKRNEGFIPMASESSAEGPVFLVCIE